MIGGGGGENPEKKIRRPFSRKKKSQRPFFGEKNVKPTKEKNSKPPSGKKIQEAFSKKKFKRPRRGKKKIKGLPEEKKIKKASASRLIFSPPPDH